MFSHMSQRFLAQMLSARSCDSLVCMRPLDLMTRWPHCCTLAALAALGLTCSGCSFLFTKKAPASSDMFPMAPVKCTSSVVAPVFDTLIGGYQVVRTGMAVSNDDSDYANSPLTREVDIGVGAVLAAVYLSSAVYGYVITDECRTIKAGRVDHTGEKWDPPPPPKDDSSDIEPDESAPPPASGAPRAQAQTAQQASSPPPRAPSAPPTSVKPSSAAR
jgi:hypothetical protein